MLQLRLLEHVKRTRILKNSYELFIPDKIPEYMKTVNSRKDSFVATKMF